MAEFWEESVYGAGKFARCPYDYIASFVFRFAPKVPRHQVRILEIGCGAGNNLWFLNQEGFSCSGCDVSQSAIDYARARIGASADLKVASFPGVPFEGPFDLVIERGALVCVPFEVAQQTLAVIRNILKPGGRVFLSPYSSQAETVGYACHYTREQVEKLLDGWKILEFHHVAVDDVLTGSGVRGEWHVIIESPCSESQ